MEIDITDFVTAGDTWDYSGSVATHGPNASRNTWANAMRRASEEPVMLDTEAKLEAMRYWVRESGGWDGEEIGAMDAQHLNAMFIQLVTQDMREMGLEDCDPDEFDWDEYRERAERGSISGSIYRGDREDMPESLGRIFYYLGS